MNEDQLKEMAKKQRDALFNIGIRSTYDMANIGMNSALNRNMLAANNMELAQFYAWMHRKYENVRLREDVQ